MRVGPVTLIAVALLSATLGAAGAMWGARQTHAHASASSFHDHIHHQMGLSAAEEARLAPIEASYQSQRHALETRLRAANRRLVGAIAAGDDAVSERQAAAAETRQALVELQDLTIAHVVAMRAALDPGHHPAFDAALAASLDPAR